MTRDKVLDAVQRLGPVPSETLCAALGLDASTVSNHLRSLLAEDLVTYQDEARSTRGRPRRIWRVQVERSPRDCPSPNDPPGPCGWRAVFGLR